MDNINSNLKTIVSSLNEIKVVNTDEDSNTLVKLVERALPLISEAHPNCLELKEEENRKSCVSILSYLTQIKSSIFSIIEQTITFHLENEKTLTTIWETLSQGKSFSSELESKGIYKNGFFDIDKLFEKHDELEKKYDNTLTKEWCRYLLYLYKKCDDNIKLLSLTRQKEDILSKSNKKQNDAINIIKGDFEKQKQNFLEKLKNKKKKAKNKKTFKNMLLEKLDIRKIASEMSKKFNEHGVNVTEESITNKAIKIMNEKIHSKDTFYLSDIDDTTKEIEENCDCDKIYESIKSNDNYKYFIEEKIFENLSKNNIETVKKGTEQHIFELIKKQVESKNKVNTEIIDSIIIELFEFILDKFDIEG